MLRLLLLPVSVQVPCGSGNELWSGGTYEALASRGEEDVHGVTLAAIRLRFDAWHDMPQRESPSGVIFVEHQ